MREQWGIFPLLLFLFGYSTFFHKIAVFIERVNGFHKKEWRGHQLFDKLKEECV